MGRQACPIDSQAVPAAAGWPCGSTRIRDLIQRERDTRIRGSEALQSRPSEGLTRRIRRRTPPLMARERQADRQRRERERDRRRRGLDCLRASVGSFNALGLGPGRL